MNISKQSQFVKITIWIVIIIIFSLVIWGVDVFFLQKHPIILLNNYSDVTLEIWATQATIASLTLASTAFILGKIEDVYYGISIKQLLHISKRFSEIGLSFWDKNIFSIIVPAITLIFVVIDNIAVVTCLFFLTVYLAASILYQCINVITKSEIYSTWAKEIIDKLVDTITRNDTKSDDKQKEIAKKHLSSIIDGIQREISLEINKRTPLIENDTFRYFVRMMNKSADGHIDYINEQMHDILIDWLVLAINVKSEPNIRTIFHCSYPDSLTSRWGPSGINILMSSYYNGDISTSFFRNEMKSISNKILQGYDNYSAIALYTLRNAVKYADEQTFVQVLRAVWRSNSYSFPNIKSNVITTTMAYLYYMAYKEQYMPLEKGYKYVEKLRTFLEVTFFETYSGYFPKQLKDIFSYPELILDGANFLLNTFNERGFNWEFISLGEAKTARLGKDAVEFLTFYCNLFFRQENHDCFQSISLDVLLQMKAYFNDDSSLDNKHIENYSTFCRWIGKNESLLQNSNFYDFLIESIKIKMFAEAKEIRQNREVWNKKICSMKEGLEKHLSKSHFYIEGISEKNSNIVLRFSDFRFLKDFSEHYACFGTEEILQHRIENYLFMKLRQHNMLDECPVHKQYEYFEDDITDFNKMIEIMSDKGIFINTFYNYPFFNSFSYKKKTDEILEKINKFNTILKSLGKWKTDFWNVAMFLDSSKAGFGFLFPQNDFITVTEELSEAELKYFCKKYKTETGYIFKECSNSVGIPFSEEELVEYLRIALIKIRYVLPGILPREKIGFYTVAN